MDTKSYARTARLAAARSCILCAIALVFWGCKSPPTNPFLARHEEAETEAQPDDPAAKTGKELAAEVEAAMDATAHLARRAAEQTAADATAGARAVAQQAASSAQAVAQDAKASVQLQAIQSLSSWPLEQAGPVLLVAMMEGDAVVRRAAAKQLAERWAPASAYPPDADLESRKMALAALRGQWVQRYGEINDAVVEAKAHAQQVLDDTQELVQDVQQVAYNAQQLAGAAAESARQVQDVVVSLKQANLPEAARREATATLERLASDASWEVRARVAHAMGELADPAFVPVLMGMLADQAEVQREALASLTLVVGADVTIDRNGTSATTDERVHRWQLWYQEHPAQRTAGAPRARS